MQKTTTCIGLQANILCKYLMHIFFQFYVISKSSTSLWSKHFEIIFLHRTYICLISKSTSQIIKILFQNGNINIFALRGVFVSRYVQLKSLFPDKKSISDEIQAHRNQARWGTATQNFSSLNILGEYLLHVHIKLL